jgi:hypothetical protein
MDEVGHIDRSRRKVQGFMNHSKMFLESQNPQSQVDIALVVSRWSSEFSCHAYGVPNDPSFYEQDGF